MLIQTRIEERFSKWVWLVVFLSGAVLLGLAIAQNRWIVVCGVMCIPLMLLWPVEIALAAFAFLVPFDTLMVIGGGVTGTTWTFVTGAFAGATLIGIGIVHQRFTRPPRPALWWGGFMFLGAITGLWALDPALVLRRLPTALALFLLYAVAVSLKIRPNEVKMAILAVIAGGFCAGTYSVYQFQVGNFFRGYTQRSSLISGERQTDPNYFAASLLLPFALCVGEFLSSRNKSRKLAMLGVAAVIAFAILLTMSRGAVLAMAVMVLVYVIRMRLNWRLLMPIALIAVALLAMPELFFARFQQAEKGNTRLNIWKVGTVLFQHYGLYGAGLDNFPVAYDEYSGSAPEFAGVRREAHNSYLSASVELGIGGLLLMLAALGSQLRMLRSASRGRGAMPDPILLSCEAAFWGLLVAGIFLDLAWTKALWLLLMMIGIAANAKRSEDGGEEARVFDKIEGRELVGSRPYA